MTVQSRRCSLPWGWCPAHSLPGVRAQLCSIRQQSATVQSHRCSLPWGWSPTHSLPGVSAQLCSMSQRSVTLASRMVFISLGMESSTNSSFSTPSCRYFSNTGCRRSRLRAYLEAWATHTILCHCLGILGSLVRPDITVTVDWV